MLLFFFFFQAEDGIRDKLVTGVQTCALPIYRPRRRLPREVRRRQHRGDPPQLRRLSGQPEKLVARRADRGRRTSASRSRGEARSGRMTSMIVNLNLGLRSYRIVVESGALDTVGARLAELRVG